MTPKVKKVVRTPAEYKEALEAAETLDLTLKTIRVYGAWEDSEGHGVFMSRMDTEDLKKVGRTYYHVELADDSDSGHSVYKIQPGRSSVRDPGKLTLTFV